MRTLGPVVLQLVALGLMLAACARTPSATTALPGTTSLFPEGTGEAPGEATSGADQERTSPGAMQEATAPAPAPTPLAPSEVDIPGASGLTLRGTYYGPSAAPAPAVLLLHMYGGTKQDWQGLALRLQASGLGCLAIDLRGHGQTGGQEDWQQAREDVRLAYAWLVSRQEVRADRSAVVGASIGANLALWLGAQEPGVAAIVLLSPGFEYFRIGIEGLIEDYGARPIFLAASEDDTYSADTVRQLAQAATGPVEVALYPSAGHGTDMLVGAPDLADRLEAFLTQHLASSGPAQP
jgi:pimeloyl-ACP methyl ester carboxylesterase